MDIPEPWPITAAALGPGMCASVTRGSSVWVAASPPWGDRVGSAYARAEPLRRRARRPAFRWWRA